eukprot:scaffold69243_cov65-Phaeocystis_antarctica.AAC.5
MSHHNEVRHVSARLHIHRFRPWAPVRLPGVCFLTNACGSPIAHFERFCSPAGWSCGTRASGHRRRTCRERLAPTCRTVGSRYGRTVAGHPAVSAWRP